MSKEQKNLKNDMLLLAIIYLVVTAFYLITTRSINVVIIKFIIYIISLFFGYMKAKNNEKVAGTIGLVIGILMMISILSLSLLDFLLGLFLFIHSLKYNKQFN